MCSCGAHFGRSSVMHQLGEVDETSRSANRTARSGCPDVAVYLCSDWPVQRPRLPAASQSDERAAVRQA
ncbi:unnamed protein product [Protopolystoma xenopodis]|uniref:Uncharacterized protein n=1 Tax=Protopolystoma xenopodis TaxID=117903 RepID=A0A448X276_9PLAT|nr:unnamed protein product [Protopolystoma xenopodis]